MFVTDEAGCIFLQLLDLLLVVVHLVDIVELPHQHKKNPHSPSLTNFWAFVVTDMVEIEEFHHLLIHFVMIQNTEEI